MSYRIAVLVTAAALAAWWTTRGQPNRLPAAPTNPAVGLCTARHEVLTLPAGPVTISVTLASGFAVPSARIVVRDGEGVGIVATVEGSQITFNSIGGEYEIEVTAPAHLDQLLIVIE